MVEFRSILQIRVAMPLAERVSCQSWVKRFTGPSMRQFLPVFPKLKSRAVPVLLNLNYAQIRRSHRRWSCGGSGSGVNSIMSQVVFSAVSLPV